MKKLLIGTGLALLLLGIWPLWHALHPPLTEEQQVLLVLENIKTSAAHKKWKNIRASLTDNFHYGSIKRSELLHALDGATFQFRSIDLQLSGVAVQVQGDTAIAEGHYNLQTRAEESSPPQVSVGDFKLWLQKEDGQWLINKGEGGNIQGF